MPPWGIRMVEIGASLREEVWIVSRPQGVAGGRPHVVPVRLSDSEKALVEYRRGGLTASAYIRMLISRDGNRSQER